MLIRKGENANGCKTMLFCFDYADHVIVIMIGCSEKETITIENYSEIELGTSQGEIYKKFGQPSGMLSGFLGDIYRIDDTTDIVMYYDSKGQVELITAMDMDDSIKKLYL